MMENNKNLLDTIKKSKFYALLKEKKVSMMVDIILASIIITLLAYFVYIKNKPATESDIFIDNFNYSVEENNLYIIKYNGQEKNLVIPDTVYIRGKGYTVTKILQDAFKNNGTLETIALPDGIDYIGESAFENCNKLNEITIPENVAFLGKNAYKNCVNVNKINYDSGVNEVYTSIDGNIFNNVGKNAELEVVIGKDVKKIPDFLFATTLISEQIHINNFVFDSDICTDVGKGSFMNADISQIVFPGVTVNFGNEVFRNSNIQEVSFGGNVKFLPDYMFYNCKKLQHIIIPDGTEIIGIRCFGESSLISINLPESINYIGNNAFANSRLQIINYKGTKDTWSKININTEKSYEFMNSKIIYEGEKVNE